MTLGRETLPCRHRADLAGVLTITTARLAARLAALPIRLAGISTLRDTEGVAVGRSLAAGTAERQGVSSCLPSFLAVPPSDTIGPLDVDAQRRPDPRQRPSAGPGPAPAAESPGGAVGILGWDKAIPQYLRMDRNSAHGFLNQLEPDGQAANFGLFAAPMPSCRQYWPTSLCYGFCDCSSNRGASGTR